MRPSHLPSLVVATSALLLGGSAARTQAEMPAVPLQLRGDVAASLELKIARAEIERLCLLSKWTPASEVVAASDKKLGALRAQLAAMRPKFRDVSGWARQQAIREKIAQLETVRAYLATQRADKTLDAERKYVANCLVVLRKNLVPISLQTRPAKRV